jgi:RHS repeat-associated protein
MSEVRGEANQPIASYYYDPMGRRLWKTLQPGAEGHSGGAGPETTYLAYSDEGYAAEFKLQGEPGAAPATGPIADSYSNVWIYAANGTWSTDPIARKTPEGWRYLQNDHLGAPQLTVSSAGTVSGQLRPAAFGSTREQGEPQALRFAGQINDRETGTHYNYFRDYEPQTGRYMESDPIGLEGGVNIYAYVGSSVLKITDSLGLAWDGTIECDGNDGFRPVINNASACLKPCVRRHEMVHVEDWKAWFPAACDGKNAGDSPDVRSTYPNRELGEDFAYKYNETECKASAESISCANEYGTPSYCDNGCSLEMDRYKKHHESERVYRNCSAFGY